MIKEHHNHITGMRKTALRFGCSCAVLVCLAAQPTSAQDHQVKALIESPDRATLSAEIPGRIIRIPVEEGDTFNEGDLLVEFDCAMTMAEKRVVLSQINAARIKLEYQQKLENLQSSGELELKLAEADFSEIRGKLGLIDVNLAKCRIRAPFTGRVLEKIMHPHESAKLFDPLLRVARTDAYDVKMIVPVEWREWLKNDQPFTFSTQDYQHKSNGTVIRFGADVDPASQTFQVFGRLNTDTNGDFLPGMAGTVLFGQDAGAE